MTIEWTKQDSLGAIVQGWDIVLVENYGFREIERIDEDEIFENDLDALIFVTREAQQGNMAARKALLIHWNEWK